MSVLGIDIGTSYCVLATIQRGAVAIVRNDLSERLTPALVGFSEKERLIGEDAQTNIRSNFKNTARNIKQLLGISKANPSCFATESEFSLAALDFTGPSESELAGYRVNYKGEQHVFSATRCMAALLTKLKEIGEKAIGTPVCDVVISVPGWFTEPARQAMLDAAGAAGLNCLRAMNEHAAVALDYGIYRSSSFDASKPQRVLFVGIGHGSASVFVADFVPGELKIQAVSNDKRIGGRYFDREIVKHFAAQFQQKHGLDPMSNPRALLKLEDAATKAKKILSANIEAPFNVECLMEDYDFNSILTRDTFTELCEGYRIRLNNLLRSTLQDNNIDPSSVHHLQIIGGCTRIPWVQKSLLDLFDQRLPISKTLVMDETVARGCALQAAMLNPRYRVREFALIDRLFQPVTVSWMTTNESAPEMKSSLLFDRGSALGIKKWLTFNRTSGFEVRLVSGEDGNPLIATIEPPAEAVKADPSVPRKFKVKIRLTHDAVTVFEEAQYYLDEVVEVKEKRPVVKAAEADGGNQPEATSDTATPNDLSSPAAEEQYEEIITKKSKPRKFDCVVTCAPRIGFLDVEAKKLLAKDEADMSADDRIQREARDLKNNLESYIYSLRDKLAGILSDFASATEKEALGEALGTAEDWLYDHLDCSKDVYEKKLEELMALGDPVEGRYAESEARKESVFRLSQTLAELRATQSSAQWQHVPEDKIHALQTKIEETDRWMNRVVKQIDAEPLSSHPFVKAIQFDNERETLVNFSKTVLVPKPEVPAPAAAEQPDVNSPNQPDDTPMDGTATPSDVDMNGQ